MPNCYHGYVLDGGTNKMFFVDGRGYKTLRGAAKAAEDLDQVFVAEITYRKLNPAEVSGLQAPASGKP